MTPRETMMQVKPFMRKRAGVIVMAAVIALAATACLPNTSSTPPADPLTNGVFQAMNADRAANGLPPLAWSPKLLSTASGWSAQMSSVGQLYHNNLSGLISSSFYAGWYTLGENILDGPGTMSAAQMESAWMNSPPHRANILNPAFDAVGIGFSWGPDGRVWATVDFGGV